MATFLPLLDKLRAEKKNIESELSTRRTVAPPSPRALEVLATISEITDGLGKYDEKIATRGSRSSKKQLRAEREELTWYLTAHQVIAGTVNRRELPVEILLHVFENCSTTQLGLGEESSYDLATFQQVCMQWNEVIQDNPSLWTRIHVNAFTLIGPDALSTILARSGERPLDIVLTFPEGKTNKQRADRARSRPRARELTEVLMTSSYRWRSLKLDVSVSGCLRFIAPLAGHLPMMEALTTDVSYDWDEFKHQDIFCNLPRLHTLGAPIGDEFPVLQLRTLSCNYRGCAFLEDAVNLQSLSLEFAQPLRQEAVFSHLTHLHVESVKNEDLRYLFSHLTTPSLSTLGIIIQTNNAFPLKEFAGFLKRSASVITEFSFGNSPVGVSGRTPLDDETVVSVFRLLPSVKILKIVERYWHKLQVVLSDTVLRALCQNGDDGDLFPVLEVLKVQNGPGGAVHDGTISMKLFAAMVKSRLHAKPSPLRHVVLKCKWMQSLGDSDVQEVINIPTSGTIVTVEVADDKGLVDSDRLSS